MALFARSPQTAGRFDGRVDIEGALSVTGPITKFGGGFRIDHPTDPANKYLNHSFVESPERKNVYDGIAVLDRKGEAEVQMPVWFDVVNRDFRYQLTAVGAPGTKSVHCPGSDEELVQDRRRHGRREGFLAGTGIRKDPWAQKKNPMTVEEKKTGKDRGRFLDPVLHWQPKEKAIGELQRPEDPLGLMKKARRTTKTASKEAERPGLLPAESKLAMSTLRSRKPKK